MPSGESHLAALRAILTTLDGQVSRLTEENRKLTARAATRSRPHQEASSRSRSSETNHRRSREAPKAKVADEARRPSSACPPNR